ncbi:MAG: hypothetical protein ACREQZ_04675 [Woeseiaceae bacterium]
MPPAFNWTTFLLGFAIALWIALVLFFVIPRQPEPPVTACPAPGCGSCCGHEPGYPEVTLWIPSGSEPYFCTNNDNGGGYVQDNGGGHVQDNGGGVVQDGAPFSPAPTPAVLGDDEERGFHEYECSTNDNGGGFVQDGTGRSAVLPIGRGPEFYCWSRYGEAVALRESDAGMVEILHYNLHHTPYTTHGSFPLPNDAVKSTRPAGPGFDYCVVARRDDEPRIIERDGTCVAPPGGC